MIKQWRTLRIKDWQWLCSHRCKHGMPYVEHQACFEQERGEAATNVEMRAKFNDCPIPEERIGFLDIESSSLKADFGFVLSYAIADKLGNIRGRALTPQEIRGKIVDDRLVRTLDSNLMKEFVVDVWRFDRIVVHWGKDRRHDIPFLRTRCIDAGAEFPLYKDVWVSDTWDIAKSKLCLHNNRLQTICDFLKVPSKMTPLDPRRWQLAREGDPESLEYVWRHNKEDVYPSLHHIWYSLEKYVRKSKTSI
jgi:uncharacterized protein YprB with RNaseH-like and TPR domain